MRNAGFALSLALLVTTSACGGRLTPRTARSQIATLGNATMIPSEIEIERVVSQTGTRAIAETSVKMAFQFERDASGEWRIVAARLGDRQWIDVETLIEALDRQKSEETSASLRKLAEGLDEYMRRNNGSLPEVEPSAHLSDVLHPTFMSEFVRQDSWGREIEYERGDGVYRLRSSGPDGVLDSVDDIIVEGRGR